MKDHRLVDERSLAFDRIVAARIPEHPELLATARANLQRWLEHCSARTRPALEEWLQALNGPQPELLDLLTGTDERARRLRQSSPFAGVFTNAERTAILREFQRREQGTT